MKSKIAYSLLIVLLALLTLGMDNLEGQTRTLANGVTLFIPDGWKEVGKDSPLWNDPKAYTPGSTYFANYKDGKRVSVILIAMGSGEFDIADMRRNPNSYLRELLHIYGAQTTEGTYRMEILSEDHELAKGYIILKSEVYYKHLTDKQQDEYKQMKFYFSDNYFIGIALQCAGDSREKFSALFNKIMASVRLSASFSLAAHDDGQEISGYKIINNLNFENHNAPNMQTIMTGLKYFIDYGAGVNNDYKSKIEFSPLDLSESTIFVNKDNQEMARFLITNAGHMWKDFDGIDQSRDKLLDLFIKVITIDPEYNHAGRQWLYFGYTRIKDYPVIYGVSRYTADKFYNHSEQRVCIMKLFYFFGKSRLHKAITVFPEKEIGKWEPILDAVIGSLVLPK